MLEAQQARKDLMDAESTYLIRVLGELDSNWLEYVEDLTIIVSAPRGEPCISTLCAHTSDQATIIGLLNSLYQVGYPLLYLQLVKAG